MAFFAGVMVSLLVLGTAAAYLGRLLSRWSSGFAFGAAVFSLGAGLAAICGPAIRRRVPDPEISKRGGAADLVLMSEGLGRLPFAVRLARSATAVIRQNLIVALGVSAVLVVASVFGWVEVSEAVVLYEGSTLVVVANGLRLLAHRE